MQSLFPSTPPLRDRLTLTCFARVKLRKDMITLFGGRRFGYVDLFRVKCTRFLLGACAETSDTLLLYPTDRYGKEFIFKRKRQKANSSL